MVVVRVHNVESPIRLYSNAEGVVFGWTFENFGCTETLFAEEARLLAKSLLEMANESDRKRGDSHG